MRASQHLLATFPFVMFELQPKGEGWELVKTTESSTPFLEWNKMRREKYIVSPQLHILLRLYKNPLEKVSYLCSIKDYISAIGKDADGPRRQIIVHVIKQHSCSWLCIIVWEKSCTISWFWWVYMSLEMTKLTGISEQYKITSCQKQESLEWKSKPVESSLMKWQ